MTAERFAVRLRELREVAGLTQRQLAVKAGLARRSVSNWEQGIREPSWGNVLALAAALGVDCTAFTKKPDDVKPRGMGRPKKEKRTPKRRKGEDGQ